jgi:hypothetical protein
MECFGDGVTTWIAECPPRYDKSGMHGSQDSAGARDAVEPLSLNWARHSLHRQRNIDEMLQPIELVAETPVGSSDEQDRCGIFRVTVPSIDHVAEGDGCSPTQLRIVYEVCVNLDANPWVIDKQPEVFTVVLTGSIVMRVQ